MFRCETWTTYLQHTKQLKRFHTRTLHMIMGIFWQESVTNQEAMDRAGSTCIEPKLLKAHLRGSGHIIRMSDSCIPRQLLYGELMQGSLKQGRPKLRFKDSPRSKLKRRGIGPRELEACAADRSAWRSLTSRTAAAFQEDRRQGLAAARDRCHRAVSTSIQTTDYRCDSCVRPALGCGVTGALIAESKDCAIIGYRRITNN